MNGNVLLDSNIIVYLSKGELRWETFFEDANTYYVSVISYMETLGFPFESKREQEFVQRLLSLFQIIYINQRIADKVVEIRQRKKMKLPDAIIAATALEKRCVLVTRDDNDFKNIEHLHVINPFLRKEEIALVEGRAPSSSS